MGPRHLREQWRSHGSGRDAIHPNRRVGQLFAERFCKGDHGGFAGAVGRRIRITILARDRSNVDDPAVVSLAHQRYDCPAAINVPSTLTAKTLFQSWTGYSHSFALGPLMPALFMSTSMVGMISSVFSTAPVTELRSLTSTEMLDPSSCFSAARAASASRSQITTLAPDVMRRAAMANPNPDAPPVTTAWRPSRSNLFIVYPDRARPACEMYSFVAPARANLPLPHGMSAAISNAVRGLDRATPLLCDVEPIRPPIAA